jgi:hypothetical protein
MTFCPVICQIGAVMARQGRRALPGELMDALNEPPKSEAAEPAFVPLSILLPPWIGRCRPRLRPILPLRPRGASRPSAWAVFPSPPALAHARRDDRDRRQNDRSDCRNLCNHAGIYLTKFFEMVRDFELA